LFGVVDEYARKSHFGVERSCDCSDFIKDWKELHTGISECISHPGIGNAVPSSLRKICRYIRTDTLSLEDGYTQALAIFSLGLGSCLICSAQVKGNIKD